MNSLADSICFSGAGQMMSPDSVLTDGVVWYSGNSTRRFFVFDAFELDAALLFMVDRRFPLLAFVLLDSLLAKNRVV